MAAQSATASNVNLWGGGVEPMKASYGKLMMWFFLISDGVADLFDGKFSVIPILIMMIFTVIGYIWAI